MGPTADQSSAGSPGTRLPPALTNIHRVPPTANLGCRPPVPPNTDDRFGDILDATLAALRHSLTCDVPGGVLRDYWLWGLDPANPVHRDFVQVIGARQLCQLTVTLLDGLIDPAAWPGLIGLSATMNVYQLFEIVSDNLGIATAGVESRPVLKVFNSAMVAALRGDPVLPTELLAGIEPPTRRLSAFAHSLAGPAHRRMATRFVAERPGRTVRDIEYGVWPALVANASTAQAVADQVAGLSIGRVLRDGLVRRYDAVNRTLDGGYLPLFELATVGAHAILVAPTLSYYVGAMGEILHPDPGFPACVADGTLPEALFDAALLVRLLNDIGPGLLTCTAAARGEVWRQVRAAPGAGVDTILLGDDVPSTVLTRLRKDLRHGEFNVALHGVRLADSVPAALAALSSAVDYYAVLYALHSDRLATGLAVLGERLSDPRPLTLIDRFVRFHERLYANPYTEAAGEYAV